MLPHMGPITIHTEQQSVLLDTDDAGALLDHIRRFGGSNMAEAEGPLADSLAAHGPADVRWTHAGQQVVVEALAGWMAAEGTQEMSQAVMDLRFALMRDTNFPHELE